MPRLPQPGGDDNTWGDVLNQYLLAGHKTDGTHDVKGLLGVPATAGKVPVTDASGIGFSWQDAPSSSNTISSTEKGSANGVASLDGSGTVPDTQIPTGIARVSDLTTKIDTTAIGAVSGVASLDASGIINSSQLPSNIVRTTDLNGITIPSGGALGQVLVKNSSNDFDVSWVDSTSLPGGFGGSTNVILPTAPGPYPFGGEVGTFTDSGSGFVYQYNRFTHSASVQSFTVPVGFIGGLLLCAGGGNQGIHGLYSAGAGGMFYWPNFSFGTGVHTLQVGYIGVDSYFEGYPGNTNADTIQVYAGGNGGDGWSTGQVGYAGGCGGGSGYLGSGGIATKGTGGSIPEGFFGTGGQGGSEGGQGGGVMGPGPTGGFTLNMTGAEVAYGCGMASGTTASGATNTGSGGTAGVCIVVYRIA